MQWQFDIEKMSSSFSCKLNSYDGLACWIGNIGAILMFSGDIPQIIHNFRRKSLEGFSGLSVAISTFGSCFVFINSLLSLSAFSTKLAGGLLLIENIIFDIQFIYYDKNWLFFIPLGLCIPVILLSSLWPASIVVTRWFSPICSILNFIPYIVVLFEVKTTLGLSMISQHIAFISGALGMLMCSIVCAPNALEWFFYITDMIQSIIIYIIAMIFGEFRYFDTIKSSRENSEVEGMIRLEPINH